MKDILSNAAKVAVASAFGDVSQIKREIKPGVQTGKLRLELDYSVNKLPDTEAEPTCTILNTATVAKAVVMAGALGDKFLEFLEAAALEAVASEASVSEVLRDDARVLKRIDDIKSKVVAKLPKTVRSGSTKVAVKLVSAETL